MAKYKYLNLEGLTEVASKVNQKLRLVETMPASPSVNDIVVYVGVTNASYEQGNTYIYTLIETYYAWDDLSNTYYTKSETPAVGDTVYDDTLGTDSGYTITEYNELNNQITFNSLTYDRDSAKDTPIYDWECKTGTSVTLNGQDKTGEEAKFYAPTTAGTEGQILMSKGNSTSPEWIPYSPSGYSPSVVDDALMFIYSVIPEVEGNAIIFDLDG